MKISDRYLYRLTVQEIVDLFNIKRDMDEMTKQIDIYGTEEFWADLDCSLGDMQTHDDDYDLFVGMVINYTECKSLTNENEEKEKALLRAYTKWMIDGIAFVTADMEQIRITVEEFMEDKECYL